MTAQPPWRSGTLEVFLVAGEDVDRHFVMLVFVRRRAPLEPVRRKPIALAHKRDAGLDRFEGMPVRPMDLATAAGL